MSRGGTRQGQVAFPSRAEWELVLRKDPKTPESFTHPSSELREEIFPKVKISAGFAVVPTGRVRLARTSPV